MLKKDRCRGHVVCIYFNKCVCESRYAHDGKDPVPHSTITGRALMPGVQCFTPETDLKGRSDVLEVRSELSRAMHESESML